MANSGKEAQNGNDYQSEFFDILGKCQRIRGFQVFIAIFREKSSFRFHSLRIKINPVCLEERMKQYVTFIRADAAAYPW